MSYSDVQLGQGSVHVGTSGSLDWNDGNIDATPGLTGDHHLNGTSPCINAGTDAGVLEDIDGDVRPLEDGFDMGADETLTSEAWTVASQAQARVPVLAGTALSGVLNGLCLLLLPLGALWIVRAARRR